MNGWMNERMNKWMGEGMSGWMDKWMNGWTNEWMKDRMNELMYEKDEGNALNHFTSQPKKSWRKQKWLSEDVGGKRFE